MHTTQLFSFSRGNSKLPPSTLIFSLPAGHTCPGAYECLSKANRITGIIQDGPATQFRCYAASLEALYSSTRNQRWRNLELLRNCKDSDAMATLLYRSIVPHLTAKRRSPANIIRRIRIHEGGDFYSKNYMKSWIKVAKDLDITLYAYTKCLHFLLDFLDDVPANLVFTASVGGKYDHLLSHFTRTAYVVSSVAEAEAHALPIDHDDSYAYERPAQAFAHLIHGPQPAGSAAMKALQQRRAAREFTGYGPNWRAQRQ